MIKVMADENSELTSPAKASQGGGLDASSTCTICMEEWSIGTDHRICALRCGHLFGRSCIEHWIKEKGQNAKCPNCNKPAKRADLRNLWCKAIKANDTTELSRLQEALENERRARKTDSATIFHQSMKLSLLTEDIERLKKIIIERERRITKLESVIERYAKSRGNSSVDGQTSGIESIESITIETSNTGDEGPVAQELKGMFHYADRVESSSAGGCRSFTLCPTSSLILVAQPTPAGTRNVFGAFGLRKFSTLDMNVREFIPLHSRMITSIQLKPIGDLILTGSQDKKVKITSINNNACVQTYDTQHEPCCVAWSAHSDQQFYVASTNCYLTLYDLRNTSEHIYQTSNRVANTRMLSIAATSGPENMNGLLVNDAKGSQFIEVTNSSSFSQGLIDREQEHMISHSLPFEGLMGTVDFHKQLGLALITTRRSALDRSTNHNLLNLKRTSGDGENNSRIECSRVATFVGGQSGELLCQSRILKHPTLSESHVLVGSCDNEARGVKLWDSSDNTVYQTIRTDLFIRDLIMHSPSNSNQHLLYFLSDSGISVYRWDYA